MPTTFTQNNGLSKPGNGEGSGTWGNTANTVFDIVDRAISGVGALTLSGTTTTLATSDGILSDGNYKVLVLGGSPSGTNTISLTPTDAQKVYMVFNNTAQSVVFKQGSGGTATITAGSSAMVYSDGGGASGAVSDLTAQFRLSSVYAKLTAINALAVTNGNFIVGNGSTWIANTPVQALVALGVTSTAAELNKVDGFTGVAADLNYAKDLRATNVTDTEYNYLDGVTSSIQTQVDAKSPTNNPTFTGTVTTPVMSLGDGFTISADANNLIIKKGATVIMNISKDGAIVARSDVSAFDTTI